MTSNFAFLKDKFPVLENFGSLAEKYCYSDANSCLMKLGMIGETIVNLIFSYDRIPVPIDNNAAAKISLIYREETRSSSTNTRTYKGYNNRTYYEEYVTYSYATSKDTQVKKGIATENEVKQDLKTGANLIVSNISQYKIGAIYSLLDALGLNEPSNLAYNLSVRVRESKIKRYTYVVEGSQKHFCSLVESSTHYYKFYDDGYESFSTYPVTWETDHFKSGYDKIAYQAYANGGDQEYFLNYVVGGSKIRSLF